MIKKTFAAAVIAVFLLSIVAVSAQNEGSENTDEKNRLEAARFAVSRIHGY